VADVVTLPGVFRADLNDASDVRSVLMAAADMGLKDVAVVGRSLSGSIEVFGSQSDADRTIALLFRGANWLADSVQTDEPLDTGG